MGQREEIQGLSTEIKLEMSKERIRVGPVGDHNV
jgi:hypothetical protein